MGRKAGPVHSAARVPVLQASVVPAVIRYGFNFAFYSIGKVRNTGLAWEIRGDGALRRSPLRAAGGTEGG